MRWVSTLFLAILLSAGLAAGQAASSQPSTQSKSQPFTAIRKIAIIGNDCLAVGDAGLLLKSRDLGATWTQIDCDRRINIQSACSDGKTTYLMGGYALAGQPEGWGQGAILASDDDFKTFRVIPSDSVGWIYDGIAGEQKAIVFGQSNARLATGMSVTGNGGSSWAPISFSQAGYMMAGDFASPTMGWAGGYRCRLAQLQQMKSGTFHPPPLDTVLTLNAIHWSGQDYFWAAGNNGTLLTWNQNRKAWTFVTIKLPPGTRRLADFRAITSDRVNGDAARRLWLAGGLIGVVLRSDDAGGTWKQLPAPGPGAINDIKWIIGDTLLAAGDAGRIWRSDDAGASWRLVNGDDKTDILFITSPADNGAYPAIVTHALAGCNIAIFHMTSPRQQDVPDDQSVRAAAILAGARGVAASSDFQSLATDDAATDLTQTEILQKWSRDMDISADTEMLRQIVAAIRLYRPAVVATCGMRDGTRGADGEMTIISKLVQKASGICGDEKLYPELSAVGLPPFSPARTFVGQHANNSWSPPWQKSEPVDVKGAMAAFNARLFPPGSQVNVEMYAQCAIWQMPWFGLNDRPAIVSAFYCDQLQSPVKLFTSGITTHSIQLTNPNEDFAYLPDTTEIEMAWQTTRTDSLLHSCLKNAKRYANTPAGIVAADRLLLTWQLLLRQGHLGQAQEMMDTFMKYGQSHPLYDRMSIVAIGDLLSREWLSQIRTQSPALAEKLKSIPNSLGPLAKMSNWSGDATGSMLLAKALVVSGRKEDAAAVLAPLASGRLGANWRTAATTEIAAITGQPNPVELVPAKFQIPAVMPDGKPDGVLNDKFWENTPTRPLVLTSSNSTTRPAASQQVTPDAQAQIIRLPAGVAIGVRILDTQAENWIVEIAADVDRDCSVQLLGQCETSGKSSVQLLRRGMDTTVLTEKPFSFFKSKTGDDRTFEILIQPENFGLNPNAALVWNMQIRAAPISKDGVRGKWRYLNPQPDDQLLPERYPQFLFAPPKSAAENTPAQPQNSPK